MLKYHSTLLPGGDPTKKVIALAFSANSRRFAVACLDKNILLYDEAGSLRDKIPTKAADKTTTNYTLRGLDFSPDGTILAVAQSDCIIIGYKLGTEWGEKKTICSKIATGTSPTTLLWPRGAMLEVYFGCIDGAVRSGALKTHKAQTLYTGPAAVSALASELRAGKLIVSGHADGSLLLYNSEAQTFRKIYSCGFTPTALDFGKTIAVSGKRALLFLDKKGNLAQRFDDAGEFDRAAATPAGDSVAFAGPSSIAVYSLNGKRGEWERAGFLPAENYLGASAALWRPDGARLAVASLSGSLDLFDLVVRRLRFKGKFELNYVSASKVRVVHLERGVEAIVESVRGLEIARLDIQRDKFVVAQTSRTLVLAELGGRSSEIEWAGAGAPKVEFGGGAAWAALAGEVTIVELGTSSIGAVFRTEFAKRAVLSVEVRGAKKLGAYLLDLQTVNVVNLGSGLPETTLEHEARIVGLQLNTRATKLLFKDARRALFLYDFTTRTKTALLPFCAFWGWIPESDVIVAQAGNALSVWYSADAPDRRVEIPVRGTATGVRTTPKIAVALTESGGETLVELDQLLVRFGLALEARDLAGCARILEARDPAAQQGQWAALLALALESKSLALAERAAVALGDPAKAAFLHATRKAQRKGATAEVEARLLALQGRFTDAEAVLLARDEADKAIEMYQSVHRWTDALRVAERCRAGEVDELKRAYAKWLVDSGQLERAGELREREGQPREAAELYLQAGLPARAASLALREHWTQEDSLTNRILSALAKEESWERLGALYERFGDASKAVSLYARAGAFAHAVELARSRAPELISGLEEKWGDSLVAENQKDSAVAHFLEARLPAKAVEAAIGARAWARAGQLLSSLPPEESEKFSLKIAETLEAGGQADLAEKYFVKAKRPARAFALWVSLGRMREARRCASEHFRPEEVSEQWLAAGKTAEKDRKWETAEKLYLEAGKPEMAIKMYKAAGAWEKMLRLFALHRPESLKEAHVLVGRRLEEEEQLARAEKHFVEAGAWAAAVDMYEKRKSFDDCLRLLKNHAGERDAVERLKRWDGALPTEELLALLRRLGLRDVLVDFLAEKKQWDEAFREAAFAKHKKADVHLALALALEDERNFREAEKHYVLAGKPDQAVQMHLEVGDFSAAASLAKAHDPALLADIQVRQAAQAVESGDFEKMEIGFIAGRKPELAVKAYLKASRPADALRVAKKHCPELVREVNAALSGGADDALKKARLLEESREFEAALDAYLAAQHGSAPRSELEAGWERAVQLSLSHAKHRYPEVTRIVCRRLREGGNHALAAEYYEAAGMNEEAIKSQLAAGGFERARKLLACAAPETQAELRAMFDKAWKAHLKSRGEAEQLVGQNEVVEGLDLMADRGDWGQALSIASTKSPDLLNRYLVRFLREAMDAGKFGEALATLTKFGLPQVRENLPLYVRLIDETFALCEPAEVADLKTLLFDFMQKFDKTVFDEKIRADFDRFLFLAHLIKLKSTYESHKLAGLLVPTCISLLRFVDLTTLDRPFYETGRALRDNGDDVQAFIFLNRYLDIFEMIEDSKNELEDAPEFKKTDIPELRSLRIPQANCISAEEKKAIRDWLLKISVSKGTAIKLPTKKCMHCQQEIYTNCVTCPFCHHKSGVCYLTGGPVDASSGKECRFCFKLFEIGAWKQYSANFSYCPWCNNKFEN